MFTKNFNFFFEISIVEPELIFVITLYRKTIGRAIIFDNFTKNIVDFMKKIARFNVIVSQSIAS